MPWSAPASARTSSRSTRADAAEALRALGWRVDCIPETAPTLAARARQFRARRPSLYNVALAEHVRSLAADPPAFVQVEHALAAGSRPRRAVALSMHNVDSEMMSTVAREQRKLTQGGRGPGTARWRPAAWSDVRCRAPTSSWPSRTRTPRTSPRSAAAARRAQRCRRRPVRGAGRARAAERVLFFGQLGYAPNTLGLLRFLREGWPRVLAGRPAAQLRVAGPGLDAALAARLREHPASSRSGWLRICATSFPARSSSCPSGRAGGRA